MTFPKIDPQADQGNTQQTKPTTPLSPSPETTAQTFLQIIKLFTIMQETSQKQGNTLENAFASIKRTLDSLEQTTAKSNIDLAEAIRNALTSEKDTLSSLEQTTEKNIIDLTRALSVDLMRALNHNQRDIIKNTTEQAQTTRELASNTAASQTQTNDSRHKQLTHNLSEVMLIVNTHNNALQHNLQEMGKKIDANAKNISGILDSIEVRQRHQHTSLRAIKAYVILFGIISSVAAGLYIYSIIKPFFG